MRVHGRQRLLSLLRKNKTYNFILFYEFENVFGTAENVFVFIIQLFGDFKIKFKNYKQKINELINKGNEDTENKT